MDREEFTRWGVITHPRRVMRYLTGLHEELAASEARREQLQSIVDDCLNRIEESGEKREEIASRLRDAQRTIEEQKVENDSLRGRLEESGEASELIREFESRLKEFEDIRRDYEKKIETLRIQLTDARGRLKKLTGSETIEDPSPIDMRIELTSDKPDDSDILQQDINRVTDREDAGWSANRGEEPRKSRRDNNSKGQKGWFRTLPDNI